MPLLFMEEGEQMALLNGLYVHAKSETIDNTYNKTNNPVEDGVDITDHIEKNLVRLQLQGELIDTPTLTAGKMYSQLVLWANEGTLIEFRGRNVFDGVITNINKISTAEISNGAEVTIDFEEMRVATSLYTAPTKNSGTQQVQTTTNTDQVETYVVQKGDWLLKIARKYNVTLEWLLANNTLKSGNPNLIYPGEVLIVSKTGLPNTAKASTNKTNTKTSTNKTTNAKKTANTVAKAVANANTISQKVNETTSDTSNKAPNYVVAQMKDKANLDSAIIIDKNGKIGAIQPIPSLYKDKINDYISRMRVYISYFEKQSLGVNTKKWIDYVKYDLDFIEKNVKDNNYGDSSTSNEYVPRLLVRACCDALDKLDKAKVEIEKGISIAGYRWYEKVENYIKTANTLMYNQMHKTLYK